MNAELDQRAEREGGNSAIFQPDHSGIGSYPVLQHPKWFSKPVARQEDQQSFI